ncbi:MAG: hypothetical protein H6686_03130 [Fibrobacteria bacterium]|nr:hypothetical protein [Fibrobacteria bacterium]
MSRLIRPSTLKLCLGLLAVGLVAAKYATAGTVTIDASSGSSCKITGGTVKATTASINFSETRTNGDLFLWYEAGPVTVNSPNKLTATSRRTGTFNLTGLTANTLYNVLLHGVDLAEGVSLTSPKYTAKAHFTTDAASGVSRIIIDEEHVGAPRFDLRGRSTPLPQGAGWTGTTHGGTVTP